MKIIVYTITNSPFCTQVKDYLTAKKIPYDEKNVEVNKEYLTEMMTASGNFAGVPFTWFQFDDGSEAGLKGFTQDEFDELLLHHQLITEPVATVPQPIIDKPDNTPTGIPITDTSIPLSQEEDTTSVDTTDVTDATDDKNDDYDNDDTLDSNQPSKGSASLQDVNKLKTEEVTQMSPEPVTDSKMQGNVHTTNNQDMQDDDDEDWDVPQQPTNPIPQQPIPAQGE